jgi:hypothetical protein
MRVGRFVIEHWREDELIEKITLTKKHIQRKDGTGIIVFPPGCIELATGDELHFDCDGLAELLHDDGRTEGKESGKV